jgi:CRISPR-associated protein Cmr2
MLMKDRWVVKTFAFLHDPPHKPCVLGKGHEEIGIRIARALTGEQETPELLSSVNDADRVSAGADRSQLLGHQVFSELKISPEKDLTLVHPLQGEPLTEIRDGKAVFTEIALSPENIDHARDLVEGKVSSDGQRDISTSVIVQAFSGISDARLRYLLLWRFLPDVLMKAEGGGDQNRFGALWELLPADTRMPTHPVIVHNSLVACLAPIYYEGKRPALLRFSLSPVQPFIEASRTLKDLWAGSSWLSLALFEAIKVVADKYGPDSVIYPYLRHQPLFDARLLEMLDRDQVAIPNPLLSVVNQCKETLAKSLRIPSLPNIFVAIAPSEEAREIGERCREAVYKAFMEKIKSALQDPIFSPLGDNLEKVTDQVKDLLDINYSVVPWPSLDIKVDQYIADAQKFWDVANLRNVHDVVNRLPGYKPNTGFLYPLISEKASALIDISKRDRLRGKKCRDEKGLKCTMCGEREVLGSGDFYEDRELWSSVTKDSQHLIKEGEHLCGICLGKRMLGHGGISELERYLQIQGRPSTAQIATARFKLEIVKKCKDDPELYKKVKEFVKECDALGNEFESFAPPAVFEACGDDETLQKFARYDGFLLLPLEQGDVEEEKREAIHKAAQALIKTAKKRGIPSPSPYLTVVVFDGDEIGRWISGDKAPPLKAMFHPMAQGALVEQCRELESVKRPVSPSIVGTISQICASFARHVAPKTIEQEGLPGYLVYAGGDDVLFLAPPADALRLVWELRLRFSGYPKGFGEEDGSLSDVRPWFISKDGFVCLAFGKDATASAGMCIFHAKHPLSDALEQARVAEKRAKEAGRNALGITVIRRSGQVTETVLPFFIRQNGDKEAQFVPVLPVLLELVKFFVGRTVSRSLGVLLHSEFSSIAPYNATLFEVAEVLAQRVIDRRLLADEEEIKALRNAVLEMGKRLRQWRGDTGELLKQWADTVALAEFVARPYGR